jgi:cytochrome c
MLIATSLTENLDRLYVQQFIEKFVFQTKEAQEPIMKYIAAALTALSVIITAGSVAAAADEAKGKRVFNSCRACHSVAAGVSKIGPSLNGIFGRTAGSWKKKNDKLFPYSSAMKKAGKGEKPLVWTAETLKKYIAAPKKFVPGNRMPFPGLKNEKKLDNLIAYLKKATK